MKIVITGASGNLGKYLYDNLIVKYEDIIGLVHNKNDIKSNNLIEWEMRSMSLEVKKVICGADILVHMAGVTGMEDKNCNEVNVEGTRKILELLRPGQLIIFASTIDINDLEEADKQNSRYARSKKETENMIVDYASKIGFKYVILRIGNVFNRAMKLSILDKVFGGCKISLLDKKILVNIVERIIENKDYRNLIRYLPGKEMSWSEYCAIEGYNLLKSAAGIIGFIMNSLKIGGIYRYLYLNNSRHVNVSRKIYEELNVKD